MPVEMTLQQGADQPLTPDSLKLPPRVYGLRRSALVEIALFLGIFLLFDSLFLGGTRMRDVSPHPFWILVLLITVQYGINEGLLSAILASAALLFNNLPVQRLSEDIYAYLFAISINPMLWLTAALILGGIRTRQMRDRFQLQLSLVQSQRENETLAEAYDQLKQMLGEMETKVAGQLCTVFSMYRAAQSITRRSEEEVLRGVKDAVHSILSPERFSLFLLQGPNLRVVLDEGWDDDDSLIRWFPARTPLFQAIVEEGSFLCVAQPGEADILDGQGLLAGPVCDPDSGVVLGMLKVESMQFIALSLETVDLFKLLCDWIGLALAQARACEAALAERFQSTNPRLLSASVLEHQQGYVASICQRFGLTASMIIVNPLKTNALDEAQHRTLEDTFAGAVQDCLRSSDIAFQYGRQGLGFMVLLVGATVEAGEDVVARLSTEMRERLPVSMNHLEIKYYIKPLGALHD